ncbi:hypothetical protein FBY35_1522 [Streptomyces sp. SLBN-118]|uniref:hypothetical protein n=1 Tax=Streptomyces sp. SLBN-118 TaxID=2768454 RepID=UPI0011500B72|nr:hypothetical protein [Streptomyces sp. SLBN-118]TQK51130.1 hypothetical protein FBY35_1522 [Streptomyces sp. SLBN-118]
MTAELPESSIPDEAWEEFQRESEGPARLDAPKEPSARARMVAERLRRADEEAARRQGRVRGLGKRGRGRTEARAEPEAWRAWPDQPRQARRRRGMGVFWVAAAVVVVLLVMNPVGALGRLV